MTRLKDFRHVLAYGAALAVLVFVLKWLQWKFLIVENAVEVYVGLVAIFFTVLGGWIASQLIGPRVQTVVVEKAVPEAFVRNDAALEALQLNRREYEVLELLAQGHSNADIAGSLFLSVSTIKTHVSNLYVKMDVKSRTQAIEKAKRLKIIP